MPDAQPQLDIGVSTGMLWQVDNDRKDGSHINSRIDLFLDYMESAASAGAPIDALEINIAEPSFLSPEVVNGVKSHWEKIGGNKVFKYISIHAPSGMDFSNDTAEQIGLLRNLVDGVGAKTVVFHPQQIIEGDEVIRQLGGVACVENMDRGKGVAMGVNSVKKYLDMGFDLVLDTKHAGRDKAGKRVSESLIKKYGDRIHHIHVSGGGLGKGDGKSHVILSEKDLQQMEPLKLLIQNGINVPVIHEGVIQPWQEAAFGLNGVIRNELLKITGTLLEKKVSF